VRPVRSAATSRFNRWGAINTVSPLKCWRTLWLKAVLAYGRTPLGAITSAPLVKMRVIALGRWTLLPSRERPRYLMFETNWSGAEQSYIADFATVMPSQWRSIWNNTANFPGPLPTTRLLAHIDTVDWGADHYWSDYREYATTHTIVNALELQDKLEKLIDRTRGASPSEFATEWARFSTDAQALL
jgi:hypothetical protein